jgi:tetratricopeptide (TPR) repeat protein
VIELLLEADHVLTLGMVDQAERLYLQAAAADPQNSIAVVGLARVALERDDDDGALREARRALAIDPENVAAARLAARLEEVLAYRARTLPATVGVKTDETAAAGAGDAECETEPDAAPIKPPEAAPIDPTAPSCGILDRLLRRNKL